MFVIHNRNLCLDSSVEDGEGGRFFNSPFMLTIERNLNNKGFIEDIDSINLVEDVNFFNEKLYNELKEKYPEDTERDLQRQSNKKTYKLKENVLKWLKENISDVENNFNKNHNVGWATGTDEYNTNSFNGVAIFFQKKEDVKLFIKEFSEYSNMTRYFNYFDEERFELNMKTNILEKVDSF